MSNTLQGRIQDLKLGGTHLKKLRQAKGGVKMFGVFRVKYHDFTPKNLIFSIAEGGAKMFEVFRVKNHDFTPKNHIFSIAEGGAKIFEVFRVKNHDFTPTIFFLSILGGCAPGAPPLNPPLHCVVFLLCFSSSCVPYVVSFSRLFIFDSPFGIL
jgi:hypothetical protein